MQKYDWPRLFAEVRPTFLPYARFKVQTHLSPEQCQQKLASITQAQKMPALISAPTSDNPRLIFKGQVSRTSFFVVPVDRTGRRRFQGPQPFWVMGRLRSNFGGSDITVKVFLDPFCLLVGCGFLGVVAIQTFEVWSSPELYFNLGKPFL